MSFVTVLVFVLQSSFYITLFSFVPLGLLFRFLIIKNSDLTKGMKALVTIDFTSFSFFFLLKENIKGQKLYNIFLITYGVLAVFAFAFGINMYF